MDVIVEEELYMRLVVLVVVNRKGVVCGVIKRGGEGLEFSIIIDMILVV